MHARFGLFLTAAILAAGPASGQDWFEGYKPVKMERVPASIQAAAKKKFPDVKFTKAGDDGSEKYFQLYGRDRSGKEVEFVADEKVSQISSTVYVPLKLEELPDPVRQGHRKVMDNKFNRTSRFEAAKIVRADLTKEFFPGVEKKSWYEFYGKNAKGEIMMDRIDPGAEIGTRIIFRRQAGNLFPEPPKEAVP